MCRSDGRAVTGRLASAPRFGYSRAGRAMALATLAVTVWDPEDEDGGEPWAAFVEPVTICVRVAAFDEAAETLRLHREGSIVTVAGRFEERPYTAKDGTACHALTVIAEAVFGPVRE